MSKKNNGTTTEDTNVRTAEKAFEAIRPRLDAMILAENDTPRIDLQAASVHSLGVARVLGAPEVRPKVQAIAATGVIDLALLDGLESVAWATWYARHRFLDADATYTEAALPPAVAEAAGTVRTRMIKTLAYHLEDDAHATARIVAIRAGTSHLAIANGLVVLAEMYREHWDDIKNDPKNFRPTDPDDAAKLSEQILRLLGVSVSPEQALWKGYCAKCAKLLFQHYEEATRVGHFLWYYENAEERFPSLHSVTRAAPAPRKKNGAAEQGKTGDAKARADGKGRAEESKPTTEDTVRGKAEGGKGQGEAEGTEG